MICSEYSLKNFEFTEINAPIDPILEYSLAAIISSALSTPYNKQMHRYRTLATTGFVFVFLGLVKVLNLLEVASPEFIVKSTAEISGLL